MADEPIPAPSPTELALQLLTERLLAAERTITLLRTSLLKQQMTTDGIINLLANGQAAQG